MLSLPEYGTSLRWSYDERRLEQLRTQSLVWKDLLGLSRPPISIEYVGRGGHTVRAQGVTGFLQLDGLTIEIPPKFLPSSTGVDWRKALWHILVSIDETPDIFDMAPAEVSSDETFADLMGWTMLKSLRQGVMEGLPRGYVEESGALTVLRGRIDTSKMADLLLDPFHVPCIYDVYCEDTPLNRLLRWSALTLSNLVRSPVLSRSLETEAAAMGDIASTPPGLIEAEHLVLPFQYHFLLPALQVSRMLLRWESLYHERGELESNGFLWNSAAIFEDFAFYLLERVCERHDGWYVESPGKLLARHRKEDGVPAHPPLYTYPDARIMRGSTNVMTLDAKYKVWKSQPLSSDVYQVLAGGRLGRCNTVCLIYPSPTAGRKKPVSWNVVPEGYPKRVSAVFLNLMAMSQRHGEEILVDHLEADILGLLT